MKNKLHWKKRMITLAAAAVLTVGGTICGSADIVWATPASGTSISDNIVVRQSAVNGSQIASLTEGQAVSIEDETTGSDGYTWYQISFTVNGVEQTGWVRGDLLNTSDESLDSEDTDTNGTDAADSGDEASASFVFETQTGTITLTDIPEEELVLVSDRFVETSLEFSEGAVTALQLAEPDELVSDDAAIVDFYYVYGYNEAGETGWYVYNSDDGTIQKSLLNMQYSIPDTEDEESDNSAEFSVDYLTKMIISALGVICLLLLVLSIVFSVRYRRLRRILEEELDEEDYEDPMVAEKEKKSGAEPKPEEKKRKNQEPEPAKVNKGQKPKEPVRAQRQSPVEEEAVHNAGEEASEQKKAEQSTIQTAEPVTEIMGVDIMDLDSMEDTDYEALLNRYLEEDLKAGEDAAKEEAAERNTDGEDSGVALDTEPSLFAEDAETAADSMPEDDSDTEDDYDFPLEDGADYDISDTGESDIIDLSKLRMPDEEPEFYDDEDDEDDDLTFL